MPKFYKRVNGQNVLVSSTWPVQIPIVETASGIEVIPINTAHPFYSGKTITIGGFNIYRDKTPWLNIDISEMTYIVFDISIPFGSDLSQMNPTNGQIEISSAGTEDVDELNFDMNLYFNEQHMVADGTFHSYAIKLSDGSDYGLNRHNVNQIGLYSANNQKTGVPNCIIRRFRFTNYIPAGTQLLIPVGTQE